METNMKTLQECKDEVAKKHGRKSFYTLMCIIQEPSKQIEAIDEAAELYAQQFKDEIKRLKEENEAAKKLMEDYYTALMAYKEHVDVKLNSAHSNQEVPSEESQEEIFSLVYRMMDQGGRPEDYFTIQRKKQ